MIIPSAALKIWILYGIPSRPRKAISSCCALPNLYTYVEPSSDLRPNSASSGIFLLRDTFPFSLSCFSRLVPCPITISFCPVLWARRTFRSQGVHHLSTGSPELPVHTH